jgi:hypothetical protein
MPYRKEDRQSIIHAGIHIEDHVHPPTVATTMTSQPDLLSRGSRSVDGGRMTAGRMTRP